MPLKSSLQQYTRYSWWGNQKNPVSVFVKRLPPSQIFIEKHIISYESFLYASTRDTRCRLPR